MKIIDLTQDCKWTLYGVNELDQPLEIPCNLPGDNLSVLLEKNLIPDPYFGKNEEKVQWIAQKDWTFTGLFQVDCIDRASAYYLQLESVDTVAEIFLNGHFIGKSENMFLRFRAWVQDYLKEGENILEIRIQSPLSAALERKEKYPYDLSRNFNNAVENLQFLRKVQSSGGWDWGICLPVSGIYGELFLREVSCARIEHVSVKQIFSGRDVQVDVTVELDSVSSGTVPVAVKLGDMELRKEVTVVPGQTEETFSFMIRDPQLWYPVGYGAQPLYLLTVETDCEKREQKIGLRQVELLHTADGDRSAEFCFRINGKRIFCKGANWIPADAIPTRITPEKIRNLLRNALLANMNMIRAWGGGWYETEDFYNFCDENGLMVWQDCLFACVKYPENEEFLESVSRELEYQVKRLDSHPSLVLWCGDNENFWCFGQYESNNPERFESAILYDRLNRVVMKKLEQYSFNAALWNSSPYKSPYLLTEPVSNAAMGDTHYWDVWHGNEPFSAYYALHPRFCSEFGFQSFPMLQTIRKYISEGQRNIFSPEMENHQKNNIGNARILATFCQYFRMPDTFEHIVYLSQVQQAFAIQMAVEYWRTLKPYCMGTLYWQFNDNWPVASWSSLDYEGDWKILHYAAAGFYAPVLLTASPGENNTVKIHLVNDTMESVSGSLKIVFYTLDGTVKPVKELEATVPADESRMLFEISAGPEYQNGFFSYSFTTAEKVLRREYFPLPYKKYELPDGMITTDVISSGRGFDVKITSSEFAFYFFAELENCSCRWSNNALTLYPDELVILHAEPDKKLSREEFCSGLRFTHLGKACR